MKKIEDIKFFQCDTEALAQKLVGKWLVTEIDGERKVSQISEVEAYLEFDTACHANGRKRTPRTQPMWEEGGTIYVYLCYGLHFMFNIVSRDENHPEAVLIRACKEANGPAKLTKYHGITKDLNGQKIVGNDKIYLLDDGKKYEFEAKPRVGIDYASEEDRKALRRFVLKENG